jgi:SAM-dependent methyltransferase
MPDTGEPPTQSSGALGTAEPWDLVAPAYDAELVPYFTLYSRDALARAELPPSARVADVACGPGTLSLLAAAAGARVSALDVSERMVQALRARAAAAGLTGAISVEVGDGQRLPFESRSYDAAFSMFGLMFFPDRVAGMRELERILRPGRRAIISSWVPFEGPFGALMSATQQVMPGLTFGDGPPPLSNPDAIRGEMTAAGFASVSVETIVHELTVPSFDAFWDSMERTNAPLVLLRHRLGPQRWGAMGPKIRDRVRQVLGEGAVVIGRSAFFGIGAVA